MIMIDQVVSLALKAHEEVWSDGKEVSAQTQKAQRVCKRWQALVEEAFPDRFLAEHGLKKKGLGQKIDLVDVTNGVAYELKASPNNVHMEIYRDVFKALVFNELKPDEAVKTLVFIAPESGVKKLGVEFVEVVQRIAERQGLRLLVKRLKDR